jgi:lipopolysaccharide export system protein LptA
MKRVILLSCFAALALAQQSGTAYRHGDFDMAADSQQYEAGVYHLSGHVVFENDAIVLRADTADFNQASHELRPAGNVTIKLK